MTTISQHLVEVAGREIGDWHGDHAGRGGEQARQRHGRTARGAAAPDPGATAPACAHVHRHTERAAAAPPRCADRGQPSPGSRPASIAAPSTALSSGEPRHARGGPTTPPPPRRTPAPDPRRPSRRQARASRRALRNRSAQPARNAHSRISAPRTGTAARRSPHGASHTTTRARPADATARAQHRGGKRREPPRDDRRCDGRVSATRSTAAAGQTRPRPRQARAIKRCTSEAKPLSLVRG